MLSFFSIFGIQNNYSSLCSFGRVVVNCFHFSVSLGYKTTLQRTSKMYSLLWIAFIFQYLWDTKQQSRLHSVTAERCELLSFFSIFGIQNNLDSFRMTNYVVVNCFHFSVSLGYKTTNNEFFTCHRLLWIAFIFQYLWDTKQHLFANCIFDRCCELLSFFSIFGIQNNCELCREWLKDVVNCFHFSVSLGYKTTL